MAYYFTFDHKCLTFGHKYLTFGHKYLTFDHKYLTFDHKYLTFDHKYLTYDRLHLTYISIFQWEPGFNGGFPQYFVTKVKFLKKKDILTQKRRKTKR